MYVTIAEPNVFGVAQLRVRRLDLGDGGDNDDVNLGIDEEFVECETASRAVLIVLPTTTTTSSSTATTSSTTTTLTNDAETIRDPIIVSNEQEVYPAVSPVVVDAVVDDVQKPPPAALRKMLSLEDIFGDDDAVTTKQSKKSTPTISQTKKSTSPSTTNNNNTSNTSSSAIFSPDSSERRGVGGGMVVTKVDLLDLGSSSDYDDDDGAVGAVVAPLPTSKAEEVQSKFLFCVVVVFVKNCFVNNTIVLGFQFSRRGRRGGGSNCCKTLKHSHQLDNNITWKCKRKLFIGSFFLARTMVQEIATLWR
jgi:hypothetical protein